MITPFEVYLVMQLDSISVFLFATTILLGISLLISFLIGAINSDMYTEETVKRGKAQMARTLKFVPLLVCLGFSSALIPSSKTAAAMIILPALTSKEVTEPLAAEGKELYALAKQALRDAVDAKDTKTEPKK